MIKAAFFDIDGTLLDHTDGQSIFHKSTAEALAALQSKGVKVVVSTGRAPGMLKEFRQYFPFDCWATLNGQLVLDRDGTVIHTLAHSPEDVLTLMDIVQKERFGAFVLEEQESWPLIDIPQVREHYKWLQIPFPALYDPARLAEHPVLQFNIYMTMEQAKTSLSPLKHVEVTGYGGPSLDIIPLGGGKETGLQAVAEHFGIRQEETIAFGDGPNDLRMLRWAGIGVAMGNAVPELKSAADYVTTSVSDNGIKNALLELGIL